VTVAALRPPVIVRQPDCIADHVAAVAASALLAELETWPKPGLVSHVDSGSHTDMDEGTFRASVAAISPFFGRLTHAGAAGFGMDGLRAIGLEAEREMLKETGGANTHRGAIFGLGLLCAAAGTSWSRSAQTQPLWAPHILGAIVRRQWGSAILRGPIPLHSHGTDALLRFGAGGARAEAAAGFPHALEVGLPALQLGRALAPGDPEAARVQSFFALLASVEDTNLLHRGGGAGLQFAQQQAVRFLGQGGIEQGQWRERAAAVHRAFITRRLSPGGCADLLAVTLFMDALDTRL
jgi:triphosphoribosyl-dephospho-CoA synthase